MPMSVRMVDRIEKGEAVVIEAIDAPKESWWSHEYIDWFIYTLICTISGDGGRL